MLSIAEDDTQAFRIIFDHYRPGLYSYTLRLTESEHLADDVIQDVFMKLWLYRRKLPEVESFNPWLNAIARNTVFDAFRAHARHKAGKAGLIEFMPIKAEDADIWLLDKENQEWLHDALNELTPSQKKVYTLSRQQGMKPEQIAAELNISVNTAKKHLVKALQSLRIYLERHNTILIIVTVEATISFV